MKLDEFKERVVRLADGQDGLRGALAVNARQPKAADNPNNLPWIDFVASDATLDRDREIVDPSGWKLDNYRKNPVFQNSHKYGDISFTLGRALSVEVRTGPEGPYLYERIEFATEANPIAKLAYELYRGGFLKAVSVGFIPVRWENGSEQLGYRRRFLEQELLELSAVSVPANPNALAMGVKSGAVTRDDLQAAVDMLETLRTGLNQFSSTEDAMDSKAGAAGIQGKSARAGEITKAEIAVLKALLS